MYKIHLGDSAIILRDNYPENYFYSAVVDPPYLINFLGRKWDHPKNDYRPVWREAHRTLRPGAYLMAFASPRTYHKIASQIEECGFHIKDMICWVYGQGFAKAQDIGRAIQKQCGVEEYNTLKNYARADTSYEGKNGFQRGAAPQQVKITSPIAQQWVGWKTGLKPAHEPIVVAQKPTDKNLSIASNILNYGTGGIDIDGNRVPFESDEDARVSSLVKSVQDENDGIDMMAGRHPSNVIGEIEGHQRYFYDPQYDSEIDFPAYVYCPKVNSEERDAGMADDEENDHPTLKPVSLLRYLTRLVTPKGGKVLDCFMGSGSQGVACLLEGYEYYGIELKQYNFERAEQRLWHWNVVNRALADISGSGGAG